MAPVTGQLKRKVNLIPSAGVSLRNATDFVRSGACAVSGARNVFNREVVRREGVAWITQQVAAYIDIVARAKASAAPLPKPRVVLPGPCNV
jgi:2-keto-3-deoxy-6-phosphogluconate aldolase